MVDVIVLLGATVLYVAGAKLLHRAQARRLRQLPTEWREHPALRDSYLAALDTTPREALVSPFEGARGWFATVCVLFFLFSVADFPLDGLLLFSGAIALFWTSVEAARNNEAGRQLAAREHLEPPRSAFALEEFAYWTPRFVFWLGFLGAGCAVGDGLARIVG